LQPIHDPEAEWKKINEIWLAEQGKKDRKKKPGVEKSVEEEDDDDFEFVVDKFGDEDDFIPFEDERAKMPHMRRMRGMRGIVICMIICMVIRIRIIQLMTNSTRGIFLMTWTMNVLLRHYITS
jgi:hypothetical protein